MMQCQVMQDERASPLPSSEVCEIVSPSGSNELRVEDQSTTSCSRKRKDSMFPDLDVLSSFDANIDEKQESSSNSPIALKRRKVSMSRSSKSYMSMTTAVESSISTCPTDREQVLITSDPLENSNHDSLLFQLHYVSSDADTQGSRSANSSAEQFPSMSTTSHRHHSVVHPATDNPEKSPYGWFVELEDEDNGNEELAFTAITAPKKNVDLDNKVDWACAADTVDDVLGDFF